MMLFEFGLAALLCRTSPVLFIAFHPLHSLSEGDCARYPRQTASRLNRKAWLQFSAEQCFPFWKPEREIPDVRFVRRQITIPLTCRALTVL